MPRYKKTLIHGRAEIWNFFSSVQRDISRLSVANERDIELNTRREIPYLQAAMYYCVYYINTKAHNITETIYL